MEAEVTSCPRTLSAVLQVLDKYNYLGAIGVLHKLDFLTEDQRTLIRKVAKIKLDSDTTKITRVSVPSYEEMINTLNHANSLEDAINYLKQNNFLGVEEILPAVQVLTPIEKAQIFKMAGINQAELFPPTLDK